MIRRKRKVRKMRGSRTHGYGRVGQHRGGGQRGGKGGAGKHKHLWIWVLKYDREYFGKHGFKRHGVTRDVATLNVGGLDENVSLLKSGEEKGVPIIDLTSLGYVKVLGSGKVTRPLIVKATEFTELAIRKIEEAGGKAIKV
nr:50S ribosomal protein L15 [Candidatus Bathyarchaeota archaeon]